jgi:hypothetical protein
MPRRGLRAMRGMAGGAGAISQYSCLTPFLCSKFHKVFEEEVQKLEIGEQLSRLRQEAGLTQAQVAQRAVAWLG